MQIDCIIVEDEPLALERVKSFVLKVPYLNLTGTFNSALDAIGFIKTEATDLIFLDIEMDGFNGIQLIESLTHIPQIIITTAYEKYALKGYELNIIDYLLKPFQFDRFLKAVEKVHEALSKLKIDLKDFFFIKTEYRVEKIFFKDVLYIEGMSDYRYIKTEKGNIMTLQTFNELESILPKEKLCRVHKSYMVAIDKIESIERNRIKIKDMLIPVSDTYKQEFYTLLGIRGQV
jgi:two-component system LytT family response regulator